MADDRKKAPEIRAKRTAKNSVFLDLFQDKKNLLALYKTLHQKGGCGGDPHLQGQERFKGIFGAEGKGGCDDHDEFV